jgi:hypothetical protein
MHRHSNGLTLGCGREAGDLRVGKPKLTQTSVKLGNNQCGFGSDYFRLVPGMSQRLAPCFVESL